MGPSPTYDRRLLLAGEKRNSTLELWEVQRYGSDSYGDPDYVSIYGLRPPQWYARGIRLLGRTAVECTRDRLADAIGADTAALARSAPIRDRCLVVDLFAGSGNTLFWLLRHMPGARGIGFELDTAVFQLTRQSLAALGSSTEILNADYVSGLGTVSLAAGELLVAFIAPPWGDALSSASGLDLRRTAPPIVEIIRVLRDRFPRNLLLCAVQVYEKLDPIALAELRPFFDWSALRIYGLNAPSENHGILLGTRGWAPGEEPPGRSSTHTTGPGH